MLPTTPIARAATPRFLLSPRLLATLLLTSICGLTLSAPLAEPSQGGASTRVPVVVELFTSLSCETCPPAHDILRQLERSPFLGRAEILPLQMHVTSWDQDWADPRGSPFLSGRHGQYARLLGAGAEGPLFVVDGAAQVVGTDRDAVRALVSRAATEPKARVSLSFENSLLSIEVSGVPEEFEGEPLTVWLLATQQRLRDVPDGGANEGKAIVHGPVVQDMSQVGLMTYGEFERQVPVDHKGLDNIRWVVLVQSMSTSRIVGAAAIAHPRGDGNDSLPTTSATNASSAVSRTGTGTVSTSAARRTAGARLTDDEAIRRAEAFIILNGYTDEPPGALREISWEPLEFETDRERLLLRRANTLRRRAVGLSPVRKDGSPGFTIFFAQTHATTNARVVTMKPDGSGIRVEPGELPLNQAEKRR